MVENQPLPQKKSRKKTWIVVGIVLIVIIIIVIAAVSVPPGNKSGTSSTAPVQFTVNNVLIDKTTPSIMNDMGHTYYLFNITIKNTGSDNIDVNPYFFYLVTSNGTVSITLSTVETNALNPVTLSPGQTVTGQLEFAVQNGATLKSIYFEYEYQKYYAPSIPEPSGSV